MCNKEVPLVYCKNICTGMELFLHAKIIKEMVIINPSLFPRYANPMDLHALEASRPSFFIKTDKSTVYFHRKYTVAFCRLSLKIIRRRFYFP